MTVDFLDAAAGLVGTFCGEAERETERAAVFLGVAFLTEEVLVFLVAVFFVTLAKMIGEWGSGREGEVWGGLHL